MTIDGLMKQKNITKYRLAKDSGIPYTTVADICSGKAQLKKCSAETVYKLAQALDISMETLLKPPMKMRTDFELYKSNVCHRVKEVGDIAFLIETLENGSIRKHYECKWYPESLYLLAMVDYISRMNNVPICTDYDDLRYSKLSEVIYPSGILASAAISKSDQVKAEAEQEAIPEFMRFNIVENEVRNVI